MRNPTEGRKMEVDKIYLGDCAKLLRGPPDNSTDLIVTSPPYADNRKATYGGVPIKKYVSWVLPIWGRERTRDLKKKKIKERRE